ncbi:MAG: hypothetical protein MR890_04775 [Akkermansia muciniphila]|nr:hypothetical protein [Akkermansia muciniphila]
MNKRSLCLIFVIVAQVVWLGVQYALRTVELEQSPCFRLRVRDDDPQDLFRGCYQSLTFRELIPIESPKLGKSLYIGPEIAASYRNLPRTEALTDDAAPLEEYGAPTPIAVFYTKGADDCWEVARIEARGSKEDSAAPGEVRIVSEGDLCRFWQGDSFVQNHPEAHFYEPTEADLSPCAVWVSFLCSVRHYLPEDKCNLPRIWKECYGYDKPFPPITVTVDLIARPDGAVVTKQLYCNGVPWTEAIDRIRSGSFLRPQ